MPCNKAVIFQGFAAFTLLAVLAGCSSDKAGTYDSEGLTQIADQLHAKGDDVGAADYYQRALQQAPNDVEARKSLAQIFEAHGDNASAVAQYRQAIDLSPDDGELHRNLGRVYIRMNQPGPAKDQYEKALQIDSGDEKAMNGLGIALDYLGQHAAAQNAYKDALHEKPDDLNIMNNLAHSYVMVGSYNEAIKLLEPHIKDKGATPALRQNLAEAYGMSGMDADAERVGLMDLTPGQVKHNLDYYRSRRSQLSITPKFYADLGSFPTQAVAEHNIEQLKTALPKETAGLVIKTEAGVGVIGGTPSFNVKAEGFVNAAKLKAFCDKAKKADIACKPHSL